MQSMMRLLRRLLGGSGKPRVETGTATTSPESKECAGCGRRLAGPNLELLECDLCGCGAFIFGSTAGITRLHDYVRGDLIITDFDAWIEALEELMKPGGSYASDSLAGLIQSLEWYRSPYLVVPLALAERMTPTPLLISVVSRVIRAEGVTDARSRMIYASEISGPGTIGWTDATEKRIKDAAQRALAKLRPV